MSYWELVRGSPQSFLHVHAGSVVVFDTGKAIGRRIEPGIVEIEDLHAPLCHNVIRKLRSFASSSSASR